MIISSQLPLIAPFNFPVYPWYHNLHHYIPSSEVCWFVNLLGLAFLNTPLGVIISVSIIPGQITHVKKKNYISVILREALFDSHNEQKYEWQNPTSLQCLTGSMELFPASQKTEKEQWIQAASGVHKFGASSLAWQERSQKKLMSTRYLYTTDTVSPFSICAPDSYHMVSISSGRVDIPSSIILKPSLMELYSIRSRISYKTNKLIQSLCLWIKPSCILITF